MQGRFEYKLLAKYPHMKPGDVAIWERFIQANPGFFDSVDYDVLIGQGAQFDTTLNTLEGQDVGALYRKKIDVVGYRPGEIWLVEVKPSAQFSALGQIGAYDDLYREEYKPSERAVAALLTDTIGPDVANIAQKWGIILLTA